MRVALHGEAQCDGDEACIPRTEVCREGHGTKKKERFFFCRSRTAACATTNSPEPSMITPAEVKMALETKALELNVTIIGVHSVTLIDSNTVNAIFDIQGDESGIGLHFQFPL